ncbi:MAG: ABC transporter ATP-binding protein, partial [Methanomassiliicoccales archaeon]
MSKCALEITNLTKKYGNFVAVKNLSLEIEEGEIFGLLGPNGAGKSTTIRTCLGLLSKTEGDIKILGMDSHKDAIEIRRRTGYLPGDFGLVDGIKVYTFLKYLLSLSGVKSDKKLRSLAERLDLDLTRKTHELSKGNRQKVGVVQALMADQDLIILDEPTGGLDP